VAREVPPPAGFRAGWVLAGTDGAGAPVALFVDRSELVRATQGPERGLLIGRSKALAQLVLSDNSMSRRHARLAADGEGVTIEDLGSSYGVTVDGRALPPYQAAAVAAGARIGLGDVRLALAWRDG
jgi:predicted component of type VI protein secretion system